MTSRLAGSDHHEQKTLDDKRLVVSVLDSAGTSGPSRV